MNAEVGAGQSTWLGGWVYLPDCLRGGQEKSGVKIGSTLSAKYRVETLSNKNYELKKKRKSDVSIFSVNIGSTLNLGFVKYYDH